MRDGARAFNMVTYTESGSGRGTRVEEKMPFGYAVEKTTGEERNEVARALVEAAEARMCETVDMLRSCPNEILGETAREDVEALTPHLEEALEALDDIRRHRSLNDKELAQQRAFRTLLARKV
jgi:acyl-CoA reductase-like NAD-dependent aldehyde dehydrogenase